MLHDALHASVHACMLIVCQRSSSGATKGEAAKKDRRVEATGCECAPDWWPLTVYVAGTSRFL